MWEHPYVDCLPSVSGVRTGFHADTSHIFSQGVLATITLIRGVTGAVGARDCARCEVGLPLCSVAVTTLSGVGSAPSCWSESPEGWSQAGFVLFKCMFLLLPALKPLPQRRGVVK